MNVMAVNAMVIIANCFEYQLRLFSIGNAEDLETTTKMPIPILSQLWK